MSNFLSDHLPLTLFFLSPHTTFFSEQEQWRELRHLTTIIFSGNLENKIMEENHYSHSYFHSIQEITCISGVRIPPMESGGELLLLLWVQCGGTFICIILFYTRLLFAPYLLLSICGSAPEQTAREERGGSWTGTWTSLSPFYFPISLLVITQIHLPLPTWIDQIHHHLFLLLLPSL